MSHPTNDQYLEMVQENFEQAVNKGETSLAVGIINDLEDQGFNNEAKVLWRELEGKENAYELYE